MFFVKQLRGIGCPEGRTPLWSCGFRGSRNAPLNGRIEQAVMVHGRKARSRHATHRRSWPQPRKQPRGLAPSIAATLCGAGVARGGKPHAAEHEVLRAALPPAFSCGEGCNGRGKQAAVRCGITLPLPRSASRTDDESRSDAAAVIRGTPCPKPRTGSSAGNFLNLKNVQDSIGWRKPLRDCFIYERDVNF